MIRQYSDKAAYEEYTASFFNYLLGQRLVVRDIPDNAVRRATGYLLGQGLQRHPTNVQEQLRQAGSLWSAQALEIGERSGFGRGFLESIVSGTPIALLPIFKRHIPPTLVMVAARWLPDATCELVIQPLVTLELAETLDSSDENLASTRINTAITSLMESYQQTNALISKDLPRRYVSIIDDPDCPAHPNVARKLTGFK